LLNQVLSEKALPTIEDAATITTRGNATTANTTTTTTTNAPLPDVVS
jgi:hypothetical protein